MLDYEKAIRAVFQEEDRVLTNAEIFSLIHAKYPGRGWVRDTMNSYLVGLTVNNDSSCNREPLRQRAFLYSPGQGRRRIYDPEEDGLWICTDNGVQRVDVKSMVAHIDELEPGLRLIAQQDLTHEGPDQEVVARPDLLAIDRDGNYVVVGVEPGIATTKTIARVLRHIKRVKRQLAGKNPVRAIVVAYRFEENLHYVVEGLFDVKFAQYDNEHGFSYRWT